MNQWPLLCSYQKTVGLDQWYTHVSNFLLKRTSLLLVLLLFLFSCTCHLHCLLTSGRWQLRLKVISNYIKSSKHLILHHDFYLRQWWVKDWLLLTGFLVGIMTRRSSIVAQHALASNLYGTAFWKTWTHFLQVKR